MGGRMKKLPEKLKEGYNDVGTLPHLMRDKINEIIDYLVEREHPTCDTCEHNECDILKHYKKINAFFITTDESIFYCAHHEVKR